MIAIILLPMNSVHSNMSVCYGIQHVSFVSDGVQKDTVYQSIRAENSSDSVFRTTALQVRISLKTSDRTPMDASKNERDSTEGTLPTVVYPTSLIE